jgi:HrpA-like RNA helicase
MGVSDLLKFEFVTPPDASGIQRALRLLHALGAVDDDMRVAEYGRKLAKLPLDPVFGHLLLASSERKCVSEMLTAVAVLSSENLLYRPSAGSAALSDGGASVASKAAAAHRRFTSHEGDLPTFLNVYRAWRHEAAYRAPGSGGRHRHGASSSGSSSALLSHGEWCQRNFVSGRALVRAHSIRHQLEALCAKPPEQNGLGLDTNLSSGKDREAFLKCVAAGLFLQAASRIKNPQDDSRPASGGKSKGRSGLLSPSGLRGRYRTKIGNEIVSIHPTSSMFGRNPAPACVVYTELVTTKKTYIRGVTQIREEWLHDVAPNFYPEKEDKTIKP